jgi:hypothetical protein
LGRRRRDAWRGQQRQQVSRPLAATTTVALASSAPAPAAWVAHPEALPTAGRKRGAAPAVASRPGGGALAPACLAPAPLALVLLLFLLPLPEPLLLSAATTQNPRPLSRRPRAAPRPRPRPPALRP